uniref:DUF3782 domain-containing protein n=2 Tax=unclassified Candidatus Kentrum TaxID=2643149 RepID=A0A451B002_9GAMM|nr:MAG: hypothetical protein BECKUNK1418H_GA0071006_107413 [Candidatus Kentron sp. UNK]
MMMRSYRSFGEHKNYARTIPAFLPRISEASLRINEPNLKEKPMSATTTQLTYQDILHLFQETSLQMKETDRLIKETGLQMQETRQFMQEISREMAERDKKLSKQIGALGNRLGDFVQEMVRPAVVTLFQAKGIDVREVYPNISVRRNGGGIEVDLFVVDGSQAIAIECKSHATTDDIREHLDRLRKFKDFFPRYRDLELMGAVAAMVMPDDVAKYAYRQGLYVLAQNGEMVEVRNDDAFVPKFW